MRKLNNNLNIMSNILFIENFIQTLRKKVKNKRP